MAGYIATAKREDWNTPQVVVDLLRKFWPRGIDLDPCSNPTSLVPATRRVMLPDDGLEKAWTGRVFVNPPFGDLAAWMGKAAGAGVTREAELIFLCPVRTDTRAWQTHAVTADRVLFWKGRMTFVGAPAAAPFPTALLYWGWQPETFHEVFGGHGYVARRA